MSYEGKTVLNYKLVRKLGEGGFGAVYLAEHESLGRKVAIKVLHHQFASQPQIVERFFREAKAVCEIGHRAIVAIENFGTLPDTNEPFYLMEFFPGGSLHQITAERWLTSEQLIAVFDPIADALATAHAKGIVHRDLKPDNIMVRIGNDRVLDVRLLDFGIAKLLEGDTRSMTGSAMGTPAYMPPEQALDAKHVDVRADIYSFAATVYAAICRRAPFDADSVAAILLMVQQTEAPAMSAYRADVTDGLDAAIRRCLAKQRDHRPTSIAEAWAAIRGELARATLGVTPAHPREYPRPDTPRPMIAATPVAPAPSVPAATTPEVPARSKRPLVLGIAALAVVFAIVVFAVAKLSGGSSPVDAPTVATLDASARTVAVDAAEVSIDAAAVEPVSIDAPPDTLAIDAAVADAAPPDRKPDRRPGSGSGSGSSSGSGSTRTTSKCSEAYFQNRLAVTTDYSALLAELNKCKEALGPAYGRLQALILQKI